MGRHPVKLFNAFDAFLIGAILGPIMFAVLS
jgi:hypothetical protein